jgi:translation initiation factor 2 gamma subunit (eIF-2gamma)
MKSVIVGTAGHIDHGKTALVKALTGIDADRLEEEKRRGITIDIGFAHLELPAPDGSGIRLGFVDVPGHERFVRNMLAGIGGIDLVLLIISISAACWPFAAASPCLQNPMRSTPRRSKWCEWRWRIMYADHFSIRQNRRWSP